MYEAVHARPEGASTVARLAATAADYGFDGVVVRNAADADDGDADSYRERIRETYDVDVVEAATVTADDPDGAAGAVGHRRSEVTLLVVRGGTAALNRFAAEEPRVDVLARPMAGEGDLDHVVAKAAARNGVRIEFDLGPVLRSSGGRRVQHLQALRKLRELVEQYDVPFVVSAHAGSHLQLRAPRELRAVGEAAGFDADQIAAGLREWGALAERNRRRDSEAFVEPGVWKGTYEDRPDVDHGDGGSSGSG